MVYCVQMKVGACLRPLSQYKRLIIANFPRGVKHRLRLLALFSLLFRTKDARSRLAAGIFIYMSFFFAPCTGSSRTTLSIFAVPGNISTAAARTAS